MSWLSALFSPLPLSENQAYSLQAGTRKFPAVKCGCSPLCGVKRRSFNDVLSCESTASGHTNMWTLFSKPPLCSGFQTFDRFTLYVSGDKTSPSLSLLHLYPQPWSIIVIVVFITCAAAMLSSCSTVHKLCCAENRWLGSFRWLSTSSCCAIWIFFSSERTTTMSLGTYFMFVVDKMFEPECQFTGSSMVTAHDPRPG